METILINILSGAVGGNAAGKTNKKQDLGNLGNTITGALGGAIGGAITGIPALDQMISSTINSSATQYLGPAIGGVVAVYLVNFVKGVLK